MSSLNTARLAEAVPLNRQRILGIFYLAIASAIWFFFVRPQDPGQITAFGLSIGGAASPLPSWQISTLPALQTLALATALLAGIQLARGFGEWTNWILGLAVGIFIFAFLTSAAAGKSLNLAGLLATTLSKSVPLTLGALSGIVAERAGVLNIGIEGMMLIGAFFSTLIASVSGNLWLGVLAAVLAGALIGGLHAVLSIKYKVNQIISGTVINILAVGFTSFLSSKFLQPYEELNNPGTFRPLSLPLLSDIPFLGPILFNNNVYFYAMILLLALMHVGLFKHKWGLRLRAVGEHPKAADTLGIDVKRIRYTGVLLSGMLAAFAGSFFTLGSVGRFDEVMTAGRGFIALAAMIFGNWMPVGSLGAGLLFGFADSLSSRLAILQIRLPSQFLLMIPYVATMIVLAGVIGRSEPPAAEGIPYEKE